MIKVSARATAQIRRTRNWWLENRPDAPGAIDDEVQRAFAMLLEGSIVGQPVPTAKLRGVKRFHLRRIHYFLYYRTISDDVEILALWHTSRGRGPAL